MFGYYLAFKEVFFYVFCDVLWSFLRCTVMYCDLFYLFGPTYSYKEHLYINTGFYIDFIAWRFKEVLSSVLFAIHCLCLLWISFGTIVDNWSDNRSHLAVIYQTRTSSQDVTVFHSNPSNLTFNHIRWIASIASNRESHISVSNQPEFVMET